MVVMIERIIQLITFKEVIGSLMIFIAVLIVASIIWGNRTFSVKTLNQMIFHLKVPMDGTDDGIYTDWFLHTVPQSFVIVAFTEIIVFNLPLPAFHIYLIAHILVVLQLLVLCSLLCIIIKFLDMFLICLEKHNYMKNIMLIPKG